jgi:hypothetical protein
VKQKTPLIETVTANARERGTSRDLALWTTIGGSVPTVSVRSIRLGVRDRADRVRAGARDRDDSPLCRWNLKRIPVTS